MMIKPLERAKVDKWLVFKIVFLLVIITSAVYANFFASQRKKKNEEILGREIINPLKETKDFSLEKVSQKAKNLLNQTTKEAQAKAGDILGETVSIASGTASKSAKVISDFIFDATVGNIVKQIEKLPKEEKERIKEHICK